MQTSWLFLFCVFIIFCFRNKWAECRTHPRHKLLVGVVDLEAPEQRLMSASGASCVVIGCSSRSHLIFLHRVQCARSRIRTPAGQYHSVGRRQCDFEVTWFYTCTNWLTHKKPGCPSTTCHADFTANFASQNFSDVSHNVPYFFSFF